MNEPTPLDSGNRDASDRVFCNKLVNDGRHQCRFILGHSGDCHPHVNARPAISDGVPSDPPTDNRREVRCGICGRTDCMHFIRPLAERPKEPYPMAPGRYDHYYGDASDDE